MDPSALEGIPVDGFESFPEFLESMRGKIGINAAFYVGHSALRRYVMGDAAQEREATPEEIDRMVALVEEAMAAGAAGFSSTHSPTHFDSADRPVPLAAVEPRRAQGALARRPVAPGAARSPTSRAPPWAGSPPTTRRSSSTCRSRRACP